MNLDFFIVFLTGLAVIVPVVIPWLEKRDKLKKTVYLIELIKTKDELTNLIEQVSQGDHSPILVEKLKKNLEEIENNINSTKNRFQIGGFVIFISIEIFFLFNYLSYIIVENSYKTGLHFLEGIFQSPAVRILILLLIIIMAFISSMYVSKSLQLKERIRNIYLNNVIMIAIFNILLLGIGLSVYIFLKFSDPFIPWY